MVLALMRISLVGKGIWQFPLRHISEEEEERIRTEMESGGCGGGADLEKEKKKIEKKGALQIVITKNDFFWGIKLCKDVIRVIHCEV